MSRFAASGPSPWRSKPRKCAGATSTSSWNFPPAAASSRMSTIPRVTQKRLRSCGSVGVSIADMTLPHRFSTRPGLSLTI